VSLECACKALHPPLVLQLCPEITGRVLGPLCERVKRLVVESFFFYPLLFVSGLPLLYGVHPCLGVACSS
jgi:hypothetical protein